MTRVLPRLLLALFLLVPGAVLPALAADGSAARTDLARAACESIAMALANLRLREKLQNQSIRDPLTGLFNRRFLQETFEKELSRSRRYERRAHHDQHV